MNIRNLNLNLLLSLDALLSECHVSRAAERCFVSQSAMSNTLNQLRSIFNDELLIRQSRAMVPTAKALQLMPQLKLILNQVDDLFQEEERFDPKTSNRKFIIGMSEFNEFVSLPKLVKKLRKVAPNIRLAMKEMAIVDHFDERRDAKMDMILSVGFDLPKSLIVEPLFKVGGVATARKNHPIFKGKLTLKKYLAQKHVAIRVPFGLYHSMVDQTLQGMGCQRDVIYSMPHMVPALEVVRHTDYILTNGKRIAELYGKSLGLDYCSLPFDMPDVYNYLAWPKRFDHDKAHAWLRQFIVSVLSDQG